MADRDVTALALQARDGERGAIDRLLVEIRPRVLRQCQRILPDPRDAEEACQDALLSISRHLPSFEGRSRFDTWAYRVTAHAGIDTYRRLKRRAETIDIDDAELASLSRTSVIAGNRIALLDAFDGVDDRVTTPVLMRDVLGLPYDDIAAELDVPVGTVKSRIHEGRKELQRRLER